MIIIREERGLPLRCRGRASVRTCAGRITDADDRATAASANTDASANVAYGAHGRFARQQQPR
jgi:hypothetical protein